MSTWYLAGSDPAAYRAIFYSSWATASVSSTIASDTQGSAYGAAIPDLQRFLGHRVRFSAVLWGKGIARQGGLFMGVGGADNRYLAFDNMQDRALTGQPSENRYQVTLDVDRSAHWISLGIWLTGRGELDVTDPILEIVDPAAQSYMPDPSGWLIAGSAPQEYSLGLDASTMRCARPSGRITAGPRQPTGFATLLQVVSADPYRGQRVRMSGWVRSDRVGYIAALWLRGDDANGQPHTFDNMSDRPIRGTTDWTPYSIVLDIPQTAASLFYGMYLDGSGTAWVDGIAFDVVDDSIPVTRENF
jgi:hypothetical protein